jgi:hypothetical protein
MKCITCTCIFCLTKFYNFSSFVLYNKKNFFSREQKSAFAMCACVFFSHRFKVYLVEKLTMNGGSGKCMYIVKYTNSTSVNACRGR